jgi:hypothetical protein
MPCLVDVWQKYSAWKYVLFRTPFVAREARKPPWQGVEGWDAAGPGVASLGAVVGVVSLRKVLEDTDAGFRQLREVFVDFVVEIDLDVGVFRLVGVATCRSVVPGAAPSTGPVKL